MNLKDLIRRIRCCKTTAEERALIATECATIRSSFREDPGNSRRRNVVKLLFINVLGHPTNFGQIECLKLVASDKFCDKRIGYLGLSLLLNENMEILMLVTNSIKLDLSHPNHYVASLALTALANIGTIEMFQALDTEIQYLLQVSNPLIKKKAALCMKRYVVKLSTPPSIELDDVALFVHMVPKLIMDSNNGVASSGCALLSVLLDRYPTYNEWISNVPILIERMYKLIGPPGNNVPVYGDCSIGGVPDPFLQSKILRLLCRLSSFSLQPLVQKDLNNLLAQIATNQTSNNDQPLVYNPGVSAQYACVECILASPVEKGLRLLASNIIKKFLESPENNLKYVALNMLQKIVKTDLEIAEKHLSNIVDCMSDPDLYIKKLSLNVSFLLTNQQNVISMVKHFSNLLLTPNDALKRDVLMKISHALTAFDTPPMYQLEMYVKLLSLCGSCAPNEILFKLCKLIRNNSNIRNNAINQLFLAARSNVNQQLLVNGCLWAICEYVSENENGWINCLDSALGKRRDPRTTTTVPKHSAIDSLDPFSQDNIDILDSLTISKLNEPEVKDSDESELPLQEIISFIVHLSERVLSGIGIENGEYLLNCLCKMSLKYPECLQVFKQLLYKFRNIDNLELQQRACEFYLIVSLSDKSVDANKLFDDIDNSLVRVEDANLYNTDNATGFTNTRTTDTKVNESKAYSSKVPETNTTGINLLELDFSPTNDSQFSVTQHSIKPGHGSVSDDPFKFLAEEVIKESTQRGKSGEEKALHPQVSSDHLKQLDILKEELSQLDSFPNLQF